MPFDIGFVELCTVLIVSLILLGPDKLPIAARALTRFMRTVSRTVNSFKHEVDRELQMDELKRQIQEQQNRVKTTLDKANNFDLGDTSKTGGHPSGENSSGQGSKMADAAFVNHNRNETNHV